jgi:hypothetical protein
VARRVAASSSLADSEKVDGARALLLRYAAVTASGIGVEAALPAWDERGRWSSMFLVTAFADEWTPSPGKQ